MENECFADIVINKEKLSNGKDVFVVHCTNLGITSQGNTQEEAIKNIKEAVELYLAEKPEDYESLRKTVDSPLFSFIGIKKPIQNA